MYMYIHDMGKLNETSILLNLFDTGLDLTTLSAIMKELWKAYLYRHTCIYVSHI